MTLVYLDYNASAPVRPEARAAAAEAMDLAANASSVHGRGRQARAVVEDARSAVAEFAGANAERLVFTSGGSEANSLAMAAAIAQGSTRLIIGASEHASVIEAARASGLPVELLPVSAGGVTDLDWLERRLGRWRSLDGPPFAAVMAANNETGIRQPIAQIGALLRAAGGRLHVDAVAAAGKAPVDFATSGAHSLSLSAHKLGGLSGSGALAFASDFPPPRQIHGGGQERGLRGGTENLVGVAAFGAAARAAAAEAAPGYGASTLKDRSAAGRRRALERVTAAGAVVIGEPSLRTENVLCIAAEGFDAHLQVMALDLEGVMISAGSACSSGRVAPSTTLQAMGLTTLAGCAVRASGGWASSDDDWIRFADAWVEAFERHRARRRLRKVA